MVAGAKVLDPGPHLFNNPGTFMTSAKRRRSGLMAGEHVKVAVAEAAGDEADEDFPGLRWIEVDLNNFVSSRNRPNNCCWRFHAHDLVLRVGE
jgi:hypothetical protein